MSRRKDHNTCTLRYHTEVSELAKFSALSIACNKMCYNVAKYTKAYEKALVEINRITLTFQQLPQWDGLLNKKVQSGPKLYNPTVIKTKDAISKANCT